MTMLNRETKRVSKEQLLKTKTTEEVAIAISSMPKKKQEELIYDWSFMARDKQLEPVGDWYLWFLRCGRSFGKTRCGAEWVREQVKRGVKDIAIIGRTADEAYSICVADKSGLLNVCWSGDKTYDGQELGIPKYNRQLRRLKWKNGAQAKLFSSEEPEALRGSQFEVFWGDEAGSWTRAMETWDQLQFCMRLGKRPRGIITTTPRTTPLIKHFMERVGKDTILTTGSSYENDAMPESFFDNLRSYENTRFGQQEIHAEIIDDNDGALWSTSMIEASYIAKDQVPDLIRVVVAVDPATTSNVESDSTGIIVAGVDINGVGYVLGDYTMKDLPEKWVAKAVSLYEEFGASRIVYEKNQGGDMIPTLFRVVDENRPLRGVHASVAKIARAEPVSALYERGLVKHVKDLPEDCSLSKLETQMVSFEPLGKHKSPDRYDALVWALTDLMLKGWAKPQLALSYESRTKN